jgi:hypothetical protein
MSGRTTLAAEVMNISGNCVWLLIDDEEFALPYSGFLWFKNTIIKQKLNALRPTGDHFYWPKLDVDLSVESIRQPDSYQLQAKSTSH